jgi:membrane protease subunit (stomatin/prohibitin family)
MGNRIMEHMKPAFADLGLSLDTFVVDNVSLPDELQQMLDQRIGMNIIGDMGKFAQFEAAKSIPIAAANEGGVAGIGVGLGAGLTMAQQMMNAMHPQQGAPPPPQAPPPAGAPQAGPPAGPEQPQGGGQVPGAGAQTKFCMNCGKPIPRAARFCPECGGSQQ